MSVEKNQNSNKKFRKQNDDTISNTSQKTKKTLFIKNLSDDVEEEDIEKLFSEMAPSIKILAIRMIRNKEDQKKRGIAFVDVET